MRKSESARSAGPSSPAAPPAGPAEAACIVPLADLRDSPFNPRQQYDPAALAELAESIRRHGVLQHPVVRPVNGRWDAAEQSWDCEQFEIVCGHRRVRAARMAKLTSIAVVVRPMTDRQVRIAQDQENARRADVSPVERARSYRGLRDAGLTLAEIAAEVGVSEAQVREYLLLERLPAHLAEAVEAGLVAPSDAAAVCRIPDATLRDQAAWCVCLGLNPDYIQSEKPAALAKRWAEIRKGDENGRVLGRSSIRDLIERRFQRSLKGCGFPTKGRQSLELVPDRPGCDTCTDRAGNRVNLDPVYAGVRADTCLDTSCYAAKQAAWKAQEAVRLTEAGHRVVSEAEEPLYLAGTGLRYRFVDLNKPNLVSIRGVSDDQAKSVLPEVVQKLVSKAVYVWVPERSGYVPVVPTGTLENAIRKAADAAPKPKGKVETSNSSPTYLEVRKVSEARAAKAAFGRVLADRLPDGWEFDKAVARILIHHLADDNDTIDALQPLTGTDDLYAWLDRDERSSGEARALSAALVAIATLQTFGGVLPDAIDQDFQTLTAMTREHLEMDVRDDLEQAKAKPASAKSAKTKAAKKGAA